MSRMIKHKPYEIPNWCMSTFFDARAAFVVYLGNLGSDSQAGQIVYTQSHLSNEE